MLYCHKYTLENLYKTSAEIVLRSRAPFHLPKLTALHPIYAPEMCLPAESSTQADIMSRGPASTDIAYHIAINMNV